MEDQNTKPLFSERLTFQVTPEVKARLLKLADEQYGGDRQALGRAALEGCLQREYTRRGYTARIGWKALDVAVRGEVLTTKASKPKDRSAARHGPQRPPRLRPLP